MIEAYADIKFNKPIDKHRMTISIGGYEVVAKGRTYKFDFENYIGEIDSKDATILHTYTSYPDVESFKDWNDITIDVLKAISEIVEFYVDIEDEYTDEVLLVPMQLLRWEFVNTETDEKVSITKEVLNKVWSLR